MQGSAVWRELQLLLSLNLPESAYYLWEGTATCYHCDDQRLVIGAPTEQSARQLVQAYLPVVRAEARLGRRHDRPAGARLIAR